MKTWWHFIFHLYDATLNVFIICVNEKIIIIYIIAKMKFSPTYKCEHNIIS